MDRLLVQIEAVHPQAGVWTKDVNYKPDGNSVGVRDITVIKRNIMRMGRPVAVLTPSDVADSSTMGQDAATSWSNWEIHTARVINLDSIDVNVDGRLISPYDEEVLNFAEPQSRTGFRSGWVIRVRGDDGRGIAQFVQGKDRPSQAVINKVKAQAEAAVIKNVRVEKVSKKSGIGRRLATNLGGVGAAGGIIAAAESGLLTDAAGKAGNAVGVAAKIGKLAIKSKTRRFRR